MTDVLKAVANLFTGLAQAITSVFQVVHATITSIGFLLSTIVQFFSNILATISTTLAALTCAVADITHYIGDCFGDVWSIFIGLVSLGGKLGVLIVRVLLVIVQGFSELVYLLFISVYWICVQIGIVAVVTGHYVSHLITQLLSLMVLLSVETFSKVKELFSSLQITLKYIAAELLGFCYDVINYVTTTMELFISTSTSIASNIIQEITNIAFPTVDYLISTLRIHLENLPYNHIVIYIIGSTITVIILHYMLTRLRKSGLSIPLFLPIGDEGQTYAFDFEDEVESSESEEVEEDETESEEDSDVDEEEEEEDISDNDNDSDVSSEVDEYEVDSDEDAEESEEDEPVSILLPQVNGRYNLRTRFTPIPDKVGKLSAAELSNILEGERDKKACVVCQDQAKSVLVLPCKHLCLCVPCAHAIATSRLTGRRICPLCRGKIQTVMNVFV